MTGDKMPVLGHDDALTDDERKAIAALQRLARRWPKSLTLFSAAGSLIVVRSGWADGGDDRMDPDAVLANIDGIPNDGGDPW